MKLSRLLAVVAGSIALAGTMSAQNVNMLAHVDRFPGGTASTNNYAGIWGLVVNGREMAVVPARTGTLFYDCTDPRNPVEVAFIAGPTGGSTGYFWREVTSFGNYVYIGSEHGATQVVDLSNPAAPVLRGTFGSTTHTLSVDNEAQVLWASGGAGRGVLLYDLAANPINPPQIGSRTTPYVHDCMPIRGYCYLAQMFDGSFGIVDAHDPHNLVTLSRTVTPSQFPHNVAVSDDDRIAIVTEERQGDCFTVYDITNKAAPQQLVRWCSPNGATVHNVFLTGNVAHLACYSDGYWAIDMSNPAAPTPIGRFDTSAFTGNGYYGDWGCYPFQPSGVVYLSDMQSGFWIVEPACGVPHHYGDGTAGTGGFEPGIDYDGSYARVGNQTFEVVGDQFVGGATTAMVLGVAQGSTPFLGVDILVDLNAFALAFNATASGTAGAPGVGVASFPVPIPNNASLAGAAFYTQVIAVDAGGPQGLSATRGMRFAICP